jgi:predicted AlkP superfamily phosphohydrolase/phosphomutase
MIEKVFLSAKGRFLIAGGIPLVVLLRATEAQAYIGPGAGFAVLGSFLVVLTSMLTALFILLSWPIRLLWRKIRRRRLSRKGVIDRLVIIGLDGLDPDLCTHFMAQGKLPHLAALQERGSFSPLQTTYPPISPVAWSSFMTGVNPGRHNIFDFLRRNPRTYQPELSSAQIGGPRKSLAIGKYLLPLGKSRARSLRKSKPFWAILGEAGIFTTVLRVPITFPPEKFPGLLLAGMCVPDLQGTQGTFTWYTSREEAVDSHTGGTRITVAVERNRVESYVPGPRNPLSAGAEQLCLPMTVILQTDRGAAEVIVSGRRLQVMEGEYSPWVEMTFRPGLGIKIRGIARFYLKQVSPTFELYLSPINIDPEKPALPISHPGVYSVYLAKLLGKYATLGLAEDTWALNERVIDEDAFLKQCYLIHEERERMLFSALDKTREGVCICVFDATDRIQHMFFRYLEETHPALQSGNGNRQKYRGVIEELYQRMDALVGRVMDRLDDQSVLIVMSDHGFKSFRRGINLNSWLHQHGYLTLREGTESREWFENVDWEKTRAYAVGLGGLYINAKHREAKGVVNPGPESEALKRELIEKLTGLRDEEAGGVAIQQVFDRALLYTGPYTENAPDLIIGYNAGYRASWDAVIGKVSGRIFEDNRKSWSGDHCIDASLVPGVLFCNRPILRDSPHIMDIAPTTLHLFGLEVPRYMDGKPLVRAEEIRGEHGR